MFYSGRKRMTAAVLLFCGIVLIAGCSGSSAPGGTAEPSAAGHAVGGSSISVPEPQSEVKADFLKTGKSDCCVLRSRSQVAVIDTGFEETAEDVIKYLDSLGIRRIDYLIITHFDKDHVGGAAALLKKYETGVICQPERGGKGEDNAAYARYTEFVEENGIQPEIIKENVRIIIDDMVLAIYPPERKEYSRDRDNNRSLAILAQHGEIGMLFTGDAEKQRLSEITEQIGEQDCDLLKVPHHGHIESNTDSFIRKVSPEYAVICADRDDAGPDDKVIQLLEEEGARVFVTGDGAVSFVSDGRKLEVIQK